MTHCQAFDIQQVIHLGHTALNRTILELKLSLKLCGKPHRRTLNRTILELKLCGEGRSSLKHHPLNRTILELKQDAPELLLSLGKAPLNRTILELKLAEVPDGRLVRGLLIAPFWN